MQSTRLRATVKPALAYKASQCIVPQKQVAPHRRCVVGNSSNADVIVELSAEEDEQWQSCSGRLISIGVESEKVDTILKKAFGWGSQAYWRGDKENAVPTLEDLDRVLDYLSEELSISSEQDQAKLIAMFPEVLGLPEELMRENIDKLKQRFFLKGAALTGAIKRKPRVLGSTVDCEGSCEGFCTRCFCQF